MSVLDIFAIHNFFIMWYVLYVLSKQKYVYAVFRGVQDIKKLENLGVPVFK